MAKTIRWTKRCDNGADCLSAFNRDAKTAAFVPDEVTICDSCLLAKYGLFGNTKYDGCGDPLSMCPLYDEDEVVQALRTASGE